ncbi:MAG: hypothetical protein CVU56_07255 [Deltaproteobacteria bacterium HGW-Deltaproteobacteria-14]|nr:MAG: hypothetical protein CVU56_07255 [Deltaproteobacteria bacterium HGW-Deltaproteobacteria-14]
MVLAGCLAERQGAVGTQDGSGTDASDTAVGPTDTAVGPTDTVFANDTLAAHDTAVSDVLDVTLPNDGVGDTASDTWAAEDVITLGCPQAVITVAEGSEVSPQTVLHLSSSGSNGLAPIAGYQWTVEQPSGSVSVFLPSASGPTATFEVNVVGTYLFHLRVVDAEGRPSCQLATFVVHVGAPEGIHVELLWTTPNDEDETDTGFTSFGDSVGSDVDLHFLHPIARADDGGPGWFDSRYDCYWSNVAPNWGGAGVSDDPSLDRDDTDGAGPENLNLAYPEPGVAYRIGVHYWDDWGFSVAFATVRVYVYGELVYASAPQELNRLELWDVGTLTWGTNAFVPTAPPDVTTNYPVPFF